MAYRLDKEDMFFLLQGKTYGFFDEIKMTADAYKKAQQHFFSRMVKKDYMDATRALQGVLQTIIEIIDDATYQILRSNNALTGPEYTDAVFTSDGAAVFIRRVFGGKYQIELWNTEEERENALKHVFGLFQIHFIPKESAIQIELSSEETERLLTIYEEQEAIGCARFAERAGISAVQLATLIDGVKNNDVHIEVLRMDEQHPGAIALAINTKTGVAMRFISIPTEQTTCFETVPSTDLWHYILDFKGK